MNRSHHAAAHVTGAAGAVVLLTVAGDSGGTPQLRRHVEIVHGRRALATADVAISPQPDRIARASFRAEAGHITPGIRARLVDAVLDLPEVQYCTRLLATIPLGDAESLDRFQERCNDVQTRAAGATALLDARIPAAR